MSGSVLGVTAVRSIGVNLNDNALMLGSTDGGRIHHFWLRDRPTEVAFVKLCDWSPLKIQHGVIAASRDGVVLLCHVPSGRVVRTDIDPKELTVASRICLHATEGAVLIWHGSRPVLYIVSLTHAIHGNIASVNLAGAATELPLAHTRELKLALSKSMHMDVLMPACAPYGLEPMLVTRAGHLHRMRM